MGKFAIKFWNDFADRHVKVLDLHFAGSFAVIRWDT